MNPSKLVRPWKRLISLGKSDPWGIGVISVVVHSMARGVHIICRRHMIELGISDTKDDC